MVINVGSRAEGGMEDVVKRKKGILLSKCNEEK